MTSDSENESGLGQESEQADACAPSTSEVVTQSLEEVVSPSACKEKLVSAKLQKTSVKKSKSLNEKKKSAKSSVKYLCPHCDHETTNIVKHFSHKRQHRDLTNSSFFKCHLCNYESKIKGGLQRHVKRVHTKERPFTCPVCDFRSVDKPSMAKHVMSKHKQDFQIDLSMYIDGTKSTNLTDEELCNPLTDCNKGDSAKLTRSISVENKDFPETDGNLSPNSMGVDVKEEGKVTFRNAKNLSTLTDDIKAQASKKNVFERSRVQKGKLADVIKRDGIGRKSRKKTSSYTNLYSTPEYREMRARKLTCELCRKQCSSQRSLLSHFNEHKDENVFCPVCHMFIVDSEVRQAHIENHLNTTNRYTCATCLNTFAEASEVIAHQQRDHRKSINVIMECMFCSFSSRSQERFSRHMTRCHMFGSDGPKHNAFDVSKMKKLLIEFEDYKRNKIKTNIKTEFSDEPEDAYKPSSLVEEAEEQEQQAEETSFCGGPLDDEISLGDMEEELESSFFDISAHMNDSRENFQELLNESKRLGEIESSFGNGQKIVQNYRGMKTNDKKGEESYEADILSQSNSTDRVTEAAQHKVSVDSLCLTSSLGKKLVKSSVESSGRGFCGGMADIPINEFNVPLELLKESGALKDSGQQSRDNSIHFSRISSIASSLWDKKSSISAKNVQKMRQRKPLSKYPTKQSRIPSPDSTSGTK
ncbi:Zinc finger C2H2-type [Trinorchestia longiramus]|nr:Zinc finger C2H2-type [Trinorchestia longiramus]